MQQLIRINEASALQRNGRSKALQTSGLTVGGAAAPLRAPARSNRALASVARLLFAFLFLPEHGAMAAKMLIQRPHLRPQPQAKEHSKTLLEADSELKTHADAALGGVGADFLQLATETSDNATAEASRPAPAPAKTQWPWIRPTSVFRGKSSADKSDANAIPQPQNEHTEKTLPHMVAQLQSQSHHATEVPKVQDTIPIPVSNSQGLVVAGVTTELGLAAIESEDPSALGLQVDTRGAVLTTASLVLVLVLAAALWFSAGVHKGSAGGRGPVEPPILKEAQQVQAMFQPGAFKSEVPDSESKVEMAIKPLLPSGAAAAPASPHAVPSATRLTTGLAKGTTGTAPPAQEFDAAMARLKSVMRSALRECGGPLEPGTPAVRTASKDSDSAAMQTKATVEPQDMPDPWMSWIHDQLPDDENKSDV